MRPMKSPPLLFLTLFFALLAGCTAAPGAEQPPGPPTAAAQQALLPAVSPVAPTPGLLATPTAASATMTLPVVIAERAPWSVLLFTKTAGYRHDSIADGVAAIQDLGALYGFEVVQTEDAALFNDAELANYRVVIFLSTTGDILDDAQQGAFERFIQAGGAFVGVHAATDTEYDWPWYGGLVGAYFASHPAVQEAAVSVVNDVHPSTSMLPETWIRQDEWYNFATDPAAQVNVLLNLDETSYVGGTMGGSHPIAWYHDYDGGRSWYTAGGHTSESFGDPLFLAHLAGGILWALASGTGP